MRISFDRIGRSPDVEDLVIEDGLDTDDIAHRVWQYARPLTLSRDLEVFVNTDTGKVVILAGFYVVGTGTIAKEEATP